VYHLDIMMPEGRIRVGVVGAGANTRLRHIPGLQAIPGVEVACVCNRSAESSEAVAREFGIPRTCARWNDLVEDPGLDAVVVGTWPYLHADVAIAALDAGKHVLTEARMARNVREAQAMLAATRRNPRCVAQIVPSPFTLDYDETVRGLLRDGSLGRLREIDMVHANGLYADADAPLTWRQDFQLSGENMLTLGIYFEALQRWVEGDPLTLRADGTVFTRQRLKADGTPDEVKIPETLSIAAVYADGLRLHARFSGVESGRGRNEFIINGSEGTLRIDVGQGRLFLARKGLREEEEIPVPPERRRGWRVEADFVNSIRTGTPVRLTSFEDGLRYMRFTEAAWQSIQAEGDLTRV